MLRVIVANSRCVSFYVYLWYYFAQKSFTCISLLNAGAMFACYIRPLDLDTYNVHVSYFHIVYVIY